MTAVVLGLALAMVAAAAPVPQKRAMTNSARSAMETAIAKVKPALVRIHVVEVAYQDGREAKSEAFGSGVIISSDGYVITNHHVAGNAKYLTCTLSTKEEVEADLVGTDALTDIAVIKLHPEKPRTFPFAQFGDSNKLKVGDQVFAMGSPLAFSQSVTMGIVSNTMLVLPDAFSDEFLLDGEDVGSLVRWIAHDAAIYPGNSGGPLVNAKGEIVGINEIDLGLSGAIPGNLAGHVAQQITVDRKVKRSWLGFMVQPLLKSSHQEHGVLISGVMEGSPAAKAGFKPGDILTDLCGSKVDVRFREDIPLFNLLAMSQTVAARVPAIVLRGGKEVKLTIVPMARDQVRPKSQELKDWGMCASNISLILSKELQRKTTAGVRVTSVRTGGPADAAKPSLTRDDIILEVAGKPIRNLTQLRWVMSGETKDKTGPVPVIVAFDRENERYLTVVKVGLQDTEDPGREVRKSWLPVGMQVLTSDIAEAMGLQGKTGVRVTQIYPNTSAEKAGLKVGDIITALDGVPVEASQPEDTEVLPTMIRQYPIGSKVDLAVLRDGKETKLSLELTASPDLPREMKKYHDLNYDFTARDIAFMDRVRENWTEKQTGVMIESVGEGGWAALGRLRGGDLLLSVNDQPVTSVGELESQMKMIAAKKPKSIVVQVKHGVYSAYLELQASWPPAEPKPAAK